MFQHWRRNTKDLPCSGRHKLWDIENVHRVLEERPQKSTRRLSEEHGTSKNIIHHQIKTLGKSYRSCRSVPHELTPQQSQRRVDICRKLIANLMAHRFIRGIVTLYEKCVYNSNLTPRNSGSVPVNMPKSSFKKLGPAINSCRVSSGILKV